ncbi:metallopeptidase family protein [Pelagibacterium montanilacus]|uniref:metallopeptidase family protein n=1 Tax=Pelagibacterium montanilacus TaxID=2185280 RepID=UPI000F8ED65D|nr:metallopeptidase family protein [Pelagibacterium montanilacus]
MMAPSLDAFEGLAARALQELPEPFRSLAADVICLVAEFPEDEPLRDLGIDDPFGLLGLFEGIGMTDDGAVPMTGQMPNRVWLYRRPILDYWAEHTDTLGEIVTHVLIHEIGHHFGFSDEDMDRIETQGTR